ncbi:MAG: DUF6599 family protein [Terriglobia bacterium]
MKLTRLSLLASILLSLLAVPATTTATEESSLLPAKLGDWQQTAAAQADAVELERLVGEQAPLLREYGARRAEQATYRWGRTACRVTLLEMQDRSSAYGVFTLLRSDGAPVAVGEAGAGTARSVIFYQGNYFVMVGGSVDPGQLRSLAGHLEQRGGPQASLPDLPAFLPREGFLGGSDRYVLGPLALARVAPFASGDWVGFAYGAELQAARYRVGPQQATLLLISYPTPQIASARLRDFRKLFNLGGTGDPRRTLAYARRQGTLVLFVAGLNAEPAANALMDRVRYEVELSWSDPLPAASASDWAGTLVNLFIGTGVVLLAALGAALTLALLRLAVSRLLPGRGDKGDESEVLSLNLHRRP